MFGGATLAALLALLALGALTREGTLFLLALALLGAVGLSRLWERRCLTGVEYRRRLGQRRAAFGESVELEVEIVNRKLLPLSWLEVEDELPTELKPERGRVYPARSARRLVLAHLLAIRPYERVRRRYVIPAVARGEHVFGPVRLRSGDLFGFRVREETRDLTDTLVVYPRLLPLPDLGLPAGNPLGDRRARSWLFEDASRLAGAREHRPGDGLRRVHWPASARAQRLQSKVYEATTSHSLAIFLNLATGEDNWWELRHDPDALELGISAAASLAEWGLEQGYQVGVAANGLHRWTRGSVSVRPGRGPGQLERILLALGRLQPFACGGFDALLAEESPHLPWGATVVLVSAALTEPVAAAALALRARGHAVTVLLTGRARAAPALAGVTVRQIGPPEAWGDPPTSVQPAPPGGSAAHGGRDEALEGARR